MENKIIHQLLENAETNLNFPPTLLYNEGWMLRLVLEQLSSGKIKHNDIHFPIGFKWYSEALLASPFLKGKKNEKHTHADAVIGKFDIRETTKSGITLSKDCDFFYIIEAKMYSPLSSKTGNAEGYNQAARSIACLAHLIYENRKTLEIKETDKFGFYVFLPKNHKEKEKTFKEYMKRENLKIVIKNRILGYENANENENENNNNNNNNDELLCLNNEIETFINKIDIELITWEELLGEDDDSEIWKFYKKCIKYNEKNKNVPIQNHTTS